MIETTTSISPRCSIARARWLERRSLSHFSRQRPGAYKNGWLRSVDDVETKKQVGVESVSEGTCKNVQERPDVYKLYYVLYQSLRFSLACRPRNQFLGCIG